MSTSVASVVSHFPDAENGFTTTTAGSVSSGAATVTLNSVAGYTNGEPVVLVIDPTDASKKQTFTGIVDTSGVQITSVVWTAGTNQTHALGATVVDYATATHIAMMSKGIKVEHSQDGTHKAAIITSRTEDTAPDVGADFLLTYDTSATVLKKVKPSNLGLTSGWIAGQLPSVSSVTNNGNRSYDVTFGSTVASYLTPGMRVRTSRTVAAPTYMGGALNGSSHYFTKATPSGTLGTVTNNFSIKATYEPTSYAQGYIAARADSAANNGFGLRMETDGRVTVAVLSGGGANFRTVSTYQSLPLNKKTKIWATWTGGTTVIYFDGISVPVSTAATGGTAPTTAGTGGDFSIGRFGAYNGFYAPGYISDVGVFDAVLTQATIRSYDGQVLSGSETNCIGAWSLNNTANDQNAAANNLTATGGVSYTSGKAPYATDATGTATGTYDYGIVTKVATTVATVQVPEGCAIPTSGGVSAVDLSSVKVPYGFPAQKDRWGIGMLLRTSAGASGTVQNTFYNPAGLNLNLPVGSWDLGYVASIYIDRAGIGDVWVGSALSTSSSSESDLELGAESQIGSAIPANPTFRVQLSRSKDVSVSSATPYYILVVAHSGSAANVVLTQSTTYKPTYIRAVPSHL